MIPELLLFESVPGSSALTTWSSLSAVSPHASNLYKDKVKNVSVMDHHWWWGWNPKTIQLQFVMFLFGGKGCNSISLLPVPSNSQCALWYELKILQCYRKNKIALYEQALKVPFERKRPLPEIGSCIDSHVSWPAGQWKERIFTGLWIYPPRPNLQFSVLL